MNDTYYIYHTLKKIKLNFKWMSILCEEIYTLLTFNNATFLISLKKQQQQQNIN